MDASIAWADIPGWLQVALIVLAVAQVSVEIYAVVVLFRTPQERIAGSRWLWLVLILFVNLIGAIVFLAAGRKPMPAEDPLSGTPGSPAGDRATRAADVLYGAPTDGDRE